MSQRLSAIGKFAEWMLGSPHATGEGVIDVITNVRIIFGKPKGKAGGIDVRHFEGFEEVLGFKLGRELSIIILNHPTPFICVRVMDCCLVGYSGGASPYLLKTEQSCSVLGRHMGLPRIAALILLEHAIENPGLWKAGQSCSFLSRHMGLLRNATGTTTIDPPGPPPYLERQAYHGLAFVSFGVCHCRPT